MKRFSSIKGRHIARKTLCVCLAGAMALNIFGGGITGFDGLTAYAQPLTEASEEEDAP